MRQINAKYQTSGEITKNDGTPIPVDEPLMLFRGKDKVLPQLMDEYKRLSQAVGSPAEHLEAIQAATDKIVAWQKDNQDKVKTPD